MGVYPSVLWLSNFLTLFMVILVDAVLITLVLCLCGLLPKTDPSLVLLLLINYGTSIIMFTFLLSVIMKKATSGSVASFLLFILTFIPFLILISLRYLLFLLYPIIIIEANAIFFAIPMYHWFTINQHWSPTHP